MHVACSGAVNTTTTTDAHWAYDSAPPMCGEWHDHTAHGRGMRAAEPSRVLTIGVLGTCITSHTEHNHGNAAYPNSRHANGPALTIITGFCGLTAATASDAHRLCRLCIGSHQPVGGPHDARPHLPSGVCGARLDAGTRRPSYVHTTQPHTHYATCADAAVVTHTRLSVAHSHVPSRALHAMGLHPFAPPHPAGAASFISLRHAPAQCAQLADPQRSSSGSPPWQTLSCVLMLACAVRTPDEQCHYHQQAGDAAQDLRTAPCYTCRHV